MSKMNAKDVPDRALRDGRHGRLAGHKKRPPCGGLFIESCCDQSRQTVGRYLLSTVVPAAPVQFHSIEPAWVIAENIRILP